MNSFRFENFGDLRGLRVLDLGAGGGRHAIEAARRGAVVVCVELDDEAIASIPDNAREAATYLGVDPAEFGARIAVVKGDARALGFRSGSFDVVIASEILEHIDQDAAVIDELRRCLGVEGSLGISVPRAFPEILNWSLSLPYHAVAGGHIRIYTKRRLFGRLRAGGFGEITHHYSHSLHSPYWWLKCLVGLENESSALVKRYHALLVSQLMGNSPKADAAERILNPLLGKSLVVYARRGDRVTRQVREVGQTTQRRTWLARIGF